MYILYICLYYMTYTLYMFMLNKKCETEPIISHCRIGTNVFAAIGYIGQRHATELVTTIAKAYVHI